MSFQVQYNVHDSESNSLFIDMILTATMLICGICIGSGIFSAPAGILMSVGSVGMSLILWVIGAVYSIIGVMAFIELGAVRSRIMISKLQFDLLKKSH